MCLSGIVGIPNYERELNLLRNFVVGDVPLRQTPSQWICLTEVYCKCIQQIKTYIYWHGRYGRWDLYETQMAINITYSKECCRGYGHIKHGPPLCLVHYDVGQKCCQYPHADNELIQAAKSAPDLHLAKSGIWQDKASTACHCIWKFVGLERNFPRNSHTLFPAPSMTSSKKSHLWSKSDVTKQVSYMVNLQHFWLLAINKTLQMHRWLEVL